MGDGAQTESAGDDIRILYVPGSDRDQPPALSTSGLHDSVTVRLEPDPAHVRERLDQEPIDCVISRYELSAGNGIELLRRVRKDHPALPFVLVAVDGNETVAAEAVSAGVTDYVPASTPLDRIEIGERAVSAVERYRSDPDEGTVHEFRVLNERYEKIFEYSNDAIMLVDLEREAFLEVNPGACEMLGYERSELLDLHPSDIHPEDIDRIRDEFLAEVRSEGVGFTENLTCLTKCGEAVPTEISGALLDTESDDERATTMVAILRDVSEREAYRQELEQEVERLDRFTGVVTHDLRNPLNVALGRIDIVRDEHESEHLDVIERSLERMERLIEDLLAVARNGQTTEEIEALALDELLETCWSNVETDDATLLTETNRTIMADCNRLAQLFENLMRNAIEHGGETVTVKIGALDDGFYVSDDGPGIPPDDRSDVFEPGFSSTTAGTGFGLPIVKRVAEAHDWTIAVTDSEQPSQQGQGTGARFEFRNVDFADTRPGTNGPGWRPSDTLIVPRGRRIRLPAPPARRCRSSFAGAEPCVGGMAGRRSLSGSRITSS